LQTHANEHQEIEHSQKVNVYWANALVSYVVRREDILDESHHKPPFREAAPWPREWREMRFLLGLQATWVATVIAHLRRQ
jgi:hypothetical protein